MILDSEEQKELLLQVVQSTPVQGASAEVRPLIRQLEELEESVRNAEVDSSTDEDD